MLQKQKVYVHLPLFVSPHRVCNALCPSLSFAAVPGCNLPRQETGKQERVDQTINGHCLALPHRCCCGRRAGAKKDNTPGALPVSLLSGHSPTCYVTVDVYPGSRQRCQAGLMPRRIDASQAGYCVPKFPSEWNENVAFSPARCVLIY